MKAASTLNWRLLDLCTAAAFLVFLLAPAIDFAAQHGAAPVNLAENRSAAEFPALPKTTLEWAAWPRGFEAWHDDHFGLRTTLLRNHSRLKIFGLGSSPSPRILVGREHWIFPAGPGVDLWRGSDPFTLPELEAWRRCLESRQRELAKRNIAYYFVLAPSKSEIYPEFLPSQIRKGGPSRTDQLIQHLKQTSTVRVLDLRPALLAEKQNDAGDDYTYFPLGTHWTDRGAAAGLKAIVAELATLHPEVRRVDDTLDAVSLTESSGDSWAGRMYVSDLMTQRVREISFREPLPPSFSVKRVESLRQATVDQDDNSLPRAVVFHDSFGETLVPMLGRHFSHSIFVWEPGIDVALLDREKPDILIHVFNDRVLSTLQPQEFNAGDVARLQGDYESSHDVALNLDVARNVPRIERVAGGSVSVRGAGAAARVVCQTESLADTFLLPEFQTRAGTHPILRLEFESSLASTTSVLFQTKSDLSYSRRRQLHFDSHQGLNVLYVELLEPELAGRLALRPAREVGTFMIKALEVRLIAN